jgi:hypothetical protein
MVRLLPALLLVAIALAGCAAPHSTPPTSGTRDVPPSGSTGAGTEDGGRILVVGVFAEVLDAAQAERASEAPSVACDTLSPVSANFTAQRLAYASTLGLGHPNVTSQWVGLTETVGPQTPGLSTCPVDAYGIAFEPWGDRPREFLFGEYQDRIPFVARPPGAVEVNGTSLRAGERWTKTVDATVNGTRYVGAITIVNLGLWPAGNVTEYACSQAGCRPPFHEEPSLRSYLARHPEGQRP